MLTSLLLLLGFAESAGGAIHISESAAIIANSTVHAARDHFVAAQGGGLYIENNVATAVQRSTAIPVTTIVNVTIFDMRAGMGAAVFARHARIVIDASVFHSNEATEFGGCMYAEVRHSSCIVRATHPHTLVCNRRTPPLCSMTHHFRVAPPNLMVEAPLWSLPNLAS